MIENKKVSVIVPIYKVEQYIEKCVRSIMNQTYKNLEIILIDDGSPDHSGRICDELASLDNRIRVIHKENDGVSNARNTGISISKGDYIYFIDGDDYAELNAIETLVSYAEKEESDLVIADINIVDEQGNYLGETNGENEDEYRVFTSVEAADYFMKLDWGPWNKLYKREVHQDVRFPSHKIHEDEAIMFQLFANSHKIVYIHNKLYNYIKRGESTTTSSYSIRKMDWYDAWINNIEFVKEFSPKLVNKAIAKMLVTAIYNLDNLLLRENDSFVKILKGLHKYYRRIIFNREITTAYKLRATLAVINVDLYKKIYMNRG